MSTIENAHFLYFGGRDGQNTNIIFPTKQDVSIKPVIIYHIFSANVKCLFFLFLRKKKSKNQYYFPY